MHKDMSPSNWVTTLCQEHSLKVPLTMPCFKLWLHSRSCKVPSREYFRKGDRHCQKRHSPHLHWLVSAGRVPFLHSLIRRRRRSVPCSVTSASLSLFSNYNISSGACCIKHVVMRLFTLSWSTAPSKGRAREPSVCDLVCICGMQPFHTLHTRLLPSNLCAAHVCHVQTWWRALEHWNVCVCHSVCECFQTSLCMLPTKAAVSISWQHDLEWINMC